MEDVVFVVDDLGGERNSRLVKAMGARRVSLADAVAEDLARHPVIIVDVDLTTRAQANALRRALAGSPAGQHRIFAVDTGRRIEMVYANIIGATRQLKRPLAAASLKQALEEMARRPSLPSAAESIETSIASAADALATMFGALTLGGPLDLPGVTAASDEVVEAIAENGFPEWLETVRAHHHGTFQHCLIVTGVVSNFAQSTGMSAADRSMLTRAGLLHDVGKASISVAILDKPGRLSEAEMEVIRRHPGAGFDYLAVQDGIGADILSAVRSHHEYLDGSGYPDGLKGAEIGDIPRILTVCDVYGALIEQRSYKPPMAPADALAVLYDMAAKGKVEEPLVKALHRATAS